MTPKEIVEHLSYQDKVRMLENLIACGFGTNPEDGSVIYESPSDYRIADIIYREVAEVLGIKIDDSDLEEEEEEEEEEDRDRRRGLYGPEYPGEIF